jgi:hypothetical protein
MNIRRATSSDADALAKVHIDAWRMAYRGLVPDSYLDSLDFDLRAERWRESLATGKGETYVAEGDQGVLGFLTIEACRDPELAGEPVGEIWGIYLEPGTGDEESAGSSVDEGRKCSPPDTIPKPFCGCLTATRRPEGSTKPWGARSMEHRRR